ncbi:MAG: hypothetical protein CVV47_08505 [Spirochaetae bacterium HGW-Spirochaetae-3]|jgi:hypothetical protein|nr:MAG: hypothetical protein CVV47_08505 [Spirochaetae bacterium HGW-Spirochaetae-3]
MLDDIEKAEAGLRAYFEDDIEAAARRAPPPPRLPSPPTRAAGSARAGDWRSSLALAACLTLCAAAAWPRQAEGALASSLGSAAASGRLDEVRVDLAAAADAIWETGLPNGSRGIE